MACVLGIDPGLDGAMACLSLDGVALWVEALPILQGKRRELDGRRLAAQLRGGADVRLVVVELPFVTRSQQAFGAFRFGTCYGQILGVVQALGLPLDLVRPNRWKQEVLGSPTADKLAAVAYVTKRFPGLSLHASTRCRKPHEGRAEAVCLAEHARRLVAKEAA